ncbi:MAG: glycosyltransferase [Myxococcota bacterium]|nr:glycosyltransferase [Myxococcota bacterium]
MIPCLVFEASCWDWTHTAEKARHRLSWLAARGGHLVVPCEDQPPPLITGLRIHPVKIVKGASKGDVSLAVSDFVRKFVSEQSLSFVHCLGLESALAALLGGRGRVPVIVEPGATPAQRLRDNEPDLRASQMVDLVDSENRVLTRANAVIAKTTVEAATLVNRGVLTDNIWTVNDGLPTNIAPTLAPELPVIGTMVTDPGDMDLSVLAAAVMRLKCAWRLCVFFDRRLVSHGSLLREFDPDVVSRIEFIPLDEDSLVRLQSIQIMVVAPRVGRSLLAGGWSPEGVYWGLALRRPLLIPDTSSMRALAGGAGAYYQRDDPADLAVQLSSFLGNPNERLDKVERVREHAERFSWSQSENCIKDLWDITTVHLDL